VLIGHVVRPHGIRGAVRARPTGATLASLGPGDRVRVGDELLSLVAVAGTADRPILTFEGIADRAAAASLARKELRVPAARLPEVEEGSYYVRDLVGCAVRRDGMPMGRVVDVEHGPANDSMVVDGDEGRWLVPLVATAVTRISLGERLVEIAADMAVAVPGGR
jgi:16S rRNA processing protein RimM